jgi:hypothetical protein
MIINLIVKNESYNISSMFSSLTKLTLRNLIQINHKKFKYNYKKRKLMTYIILLYNNLKVLFI